MHGDSHLGVGWTKSAAEADRRYDVMLGVLRERDSRLSLLDFGCGLSHLYDYAIRSDRVTFHYSGLDLSDKFLAASKAKFPAIQYYSMDVLKRSNDLPEFDYVIMNGIFSLKADHSYSEMWEYFTGSSPLRVVMG